MTGRNEADEAVMNNAAIKLAYTWVNPHLSPVFRIASSFIRFPAPYIKKLKQRAVSRSILYWYSYVIPGRGGTEWVGLTSGCKDNLVKTVDRDGGHLVVQTYPSKVAAYKQIIGFVCI